MTKNQTEGDELWRCGAPVDAAKLMRMLEGEPAGTTVHVKGAPGPQIIVRGPVPAQPELTPAEQQRGAADVSTGDQL